MKLTLTLTGDLDPEALADAVRLHQIDTLDLAAGRCTVSVDNMSLPGLVDDLAIVLDVARHIGATGGLALIAPGKGDFTIPAQGVLL